MNTRIQVEHPVTEVLFGIDLVEAQLKLAMGSSVSEIVGNRSSTGHAIEFRINAEIWQNGFRPSPGVIQSWNLPAGSEFEWIHTVTKGSNQSILRFHDCQTDRSWT